MMPRASGNSRHPRSYSFPLRTHSRSGNALPKESGGFDAYVTVCRDDRPRPSRTRRSFVFSPSPLPSENLPRVFVVFPESSALPGTINSPSLPLYFSCLSLLLFLVFPFCCFSSCTRVPPFSNKKGDLSGLWAWQQPPKPKLAPQRFTSSSTYFMATTARPGFCESFFGSVRFRIPNEPCGL